MSLATCKTFSLRSGFFKAPLAKLLSNLRLQTDPKTDHTNKARGGCNAPATLDNTGFGFC